MNKKSLGKYNDNELYLTVAKYGNNDRVYLGLEDEEGLYADITINLSDALIETGNTIFLSSHVDNDLQEFLIEKGIIEEPYNVIQYNMGRYPVTRFNMDKVKEYDPDGFKDLKLETDEDLEI